MPVSSARHGDFFQAEPRHENAWTSGNLGLTEALMCIFKKFNAKPKQHLKEKYRLLIVSFFCVFLRLQLGYVFIFNRGGQSVFVGGKGLNIRCDLKYGLFFLQTINLCSLYLDQFLQSYLRRVLPSDLLPQLEPDLTRYK